MDVLEHLKKGEIPVDQGVIRQVGNSFYVKIDHAFVRLGILQVGEKLNGILKKEQKPLKTTKNNKETFAAVAQPGYNIHSNIYKQNNNLAATAGQ